ncbi:tyrosine-type recombinase/integrase [Herbaspirillum sp. SJZ107]|uniref:tyrosine-type recombinase/integrase n=1 Tax=Herbaspirillum sp. SJZ107 TaxID=2572881 RepID=UPI00115443D8|nr:tyrosine-type recombinase/integrase [Herbaspirillum sp. SJZ107]TQK01150.1 site-specific recombinase XerD [Herbaspirillum sp. SJZ107]
MRDTSDELVTTSDNSVVVAATWRAVEVWLDGVRHNGGDFSEETANTYSYHIAKFRWYCDRIGVSPVDWNQAHANAFITFLRDLPAECLCRKIESGRTRKGPDGSEQPLLRFAKADEPGYTPFRTTPSAGSRDDILRCIRALFNTLHEDGIIRRNPMARVKTRKSRRLNAERSLDLDLYAYVVEYLNALPVVDDNAARLRARDQFAFVALRELGLRASELVGARMRDVYPLTDPKTARTYWILRVDDEHAKGSKGRDVPMTRSVFEELMTYRGAFGLTAVPEPGEDYGLLLSVQTKKVAIGSRLVTEAKSRRYFRAWASITSRKSLYLIVKNRLDQVAVSLERNNRGSEAAQLREVSPHWLRHTFAKALIVRGRDIRVVAESLGHASVTTTMAYTRQSALDQIREYVKDSDDLATQGAKPIE